MEINATLVVQMAVFLLLFAFVTPVLFRPLMRLFDERDQRIEGARRQAGDLQKQVHQKIEEVELQVKDAQRNAKQTLEQLKAQASNMQREILDQARGKANEELQKARIELQNSTQKVRDELKGETTELADMVVRKFVESKTSSGSSYSGDKMEFTGV